MLKSNFFTMFQPNFAQMVGSKTLFNPSFVRCLWLIRYAFNGLRAKYQLATNENDKRLDVKQQMRTAEDLRWDVLYFSNDKC